MYMSHTNDPYFPNIPLHFFIIQILAEPDDGWNKVKEKDGDRL